jgi:PAS domain S-box-containing protein
MVISASLCRLHTGCTNDVVGRFSNTFKLRRTGLINSIALPSSSHYLSFKANIYMNLNVLLKLLPLSTFCFNLSVEVSDVIRNIAGRKLNCLLCGWERLRLFTLCVELIITVLITMSSKRSLVDLSSGHDSAHASKKAAIGGGGTFDDDMPFCKIVLKRERSYFTAIEINRAFETHISPLFKMVGLNFLSLVVAGPQRQALLDAIEAASIAAAASASNSENGSNGSRNNGRASSRATTIAARARNIEMTTLAESNAGLPIRCRFDWTVARANNSVVVLYGDPCTDNSTCHRSNCNEEQRAQDAELVRFFQSAPIALHWISNEGFVLWSNQAGLEIIGTSADDYIGQPIVNFCPDDKDLVEQILQQLAQGNTVKDVPIRFRTRNGRTVDLLIETHVQFDEKDGSIAHSRCFVRDDTKRQIREARASLLQEETKRSLQMLDNFMSRSLHHMRSPLHVLQTSMDIVKQHLGEISSRVMDQPDLAELVDDCDFCIVRARAHVTKAVDMIDDISDLARLDQGQPLRLSNDLIQLKDLGTDVFAHADVPSSVEVALELSGGHGPPFIHSDHRYLKKVLCNIVDHLCNHAASDVMRTITLKIGHTAETCVFSVTEACTGRLPRTSSTLKGDTSTSSLMDDGALGSNSAHNSTSSLPAIFQRYHQELLPLEESLSHGIDLDKASDRRDNIVTGINSLRHNSMGMSLSLAYHLVRTLGGDLRYASKPDKFTRFWFSLPHNNGGVLSSERIVFDRPKVRYAGLYTKPNEEPMQYNKMPAPVPTATAMTKSPPLPPILAASSTSAPLLPYVMDSPSVLVVEDVPICAKLLCTILRQFKCTATWVKNGQEAVDLLTKEPDRHTLIFMDLRMPVMDGLTATKIIKNKLKLQTPVVALTGEGGDQIRNECMEIGFDAYCKKPMTREELMKVVHEHTGYVHH